MTREGSLVSAATNRREMWRPELLLLATEGAGLLPRKPTPEAPIMEVVLAGSGVQGTSIDVLQADGAGDVIQGKPLGSVVGHTWANLNEKAVPQGCLLLPVLKAVIAVAAGLLPGSRDNGIRTSFLARESPPAANKATGLGDHFTAAGGARNFTLQDEVECREVLLVDDIVAKGLAFFVGAYTLDRVRPRHSSNGGHRH